MMTISIRDRTLKLKGVVGYSDPGHGVGVRFKDLDAGDRSLSAGASGAIVEKCSTSFTLGIEEEFSDSRPAGRVSYGRTSLRSLRRANCCWVSSSSLRLIQSMVEVGTGVCANIQEAREDITKLRCITSPGLQGKKGMAIVAASTHPFSKWSEQEIYDGARYKLLVDELLMVARSLLIFGLHVHVAAKDSDAAVSTS
jgi:carboxylate-amine ligase